MVSLSSAGDTNWTYGYSGTGVAGNGANSIVYGNDGNIYVAGVCCDGGTSWDFFVTSLSTDGDAHWTYRLQGFQDLDDDAKEIIYGSDGNINVAGTLVDSMSAKDFVVVSLDSDGTENWIYSYTAASSYWWDEALAITYGCDDNVYTVGYSIDSTSMHLWNFTVICLEPYTRIEEEEEYGTNDVAVVLTAAPDPFTDVTDIRCQTTDTRQRCELRIYHITGRLVTNLSDQISVIGNQSSVKWDGTDASGNKLPGGVYFAGLRCGNDTTMERLLLVR